MATSKKSVAALQKDLETLDERIEALEQQLRRYRDSRKKLKARIHEVQGSELIGILAQHEIPFEAAKDILASARQIKNEEVGP